MCIRWDVTFLVVAVLLLLKAELAVMGFATLVLVYYLLPAKLQGLIQLLWTRDKSRK